MLGIAMEGDGSRTAFELSCVQQRRDSAEITAVAVDTDGYRLYVGLDNGMLEEYKLLFAQGNEVARVSARRSVSKKSIKGLCQTGNANCLSILIEDGAVLLCDMDHLDPKPLPGVKNAVAIASDTMRSSPCVLAVAIPARLSTKKTSIDVFEIDPDGLVGTGSPAQLIQQHTIQEEVKALKWMNGQILFCTKQAYKSINGSNVSDFLKPSCVPMLTAIPAAGVVALLWEDTMAVIADTDGSAARPPLNLPSRPIILSQGGMCVVAGRREESSDVYDLTSGDTSSGSCVILASMKRIWVLRPVAPEMQAVQLLKAKSYDAALDLAEQCDGGEATWVGTCFAQAGLLLIQELRWQRGVEALAKCSPQEFQPCELFALFPEWTSMYTHKIPKNEYWGLHTELVDVPTMVKRFGIRRQMSINEIEPVTPWHPEKSSDAEASTSRREEHILEARQWVASYLIKVRGRNGVECLEGIDTLIVHLLASIGDAGRLELFLSSSQHAKLEGVRSFLLASSRPHALALLLSELGDCSGALDVWQQMAASQVSEGPSTAGAAVEAGGDGTRVAKYYVARTLLDEGKVSDDLALHHLKWLRDSSPHRFTQVIKMRKLPIPQVLKLLKGQYLELQWRYLEHLIHSNLTEDPGHHTEHAHVLIKSICESHLDIEDVSISPDKGDGWGLEASAALLRTGSVKRESGMVLGRYRLEPQYELGDPPGCYMHPDSLVSPSRADLRFALQSHLVRSRFYHAKDVLKAVEGTWLYEEQVILYCRLLDHPKALRVLAVTLNDTNAAIRYCKKHAGHEGFIALLEMLLRPGEGREPMYTEACQVLNAESGNLDPMRVLEALSEDMPLSIAYSTLSRMLRERIHRKRQTGIVHQLYRSREVLSRSEQYELQSTSKGRVVVEPDSQCAICNKLVGGRIFYRYPNHSLVCASCHREIREKMSSQAQSRK